VQEKKKKKRKKIRTVEDGRYTGATEVSLRLLLIPLPLGVESKGNQACSKESDRRGFGYGVIATAAGPPTRAVTRKRYRGYDPRNKKNRRQRDSKYTHNFLHGTPPNFLFTLS
jgi:hypothetical protein